MSEPTRPGGADALAALSLIEGFLRGDQAARALWTDAFATTDAAATAFGYLAGFLLETLATERREDVATTAHHIRTVLEHRAD